MTEQLGTVRVGLLHPGEMGAALGRALVSRGAEVRWASEGRSPASRARAERARLIEVPTLGDLVAESHLIVSVCPPAGAESLARKVSSSGFHGVYVDLNAVSPGTARGIGTVVGSKGATFVDGCIVGEPPRAPGTTRLYLAGDDAASVAQLLAGTLFETRVLAGPVGSASALKAAYAAWTKTSSALLLAIVAFASVSGVERALLAEWAISQPDLADRCERSARPTARKAWRHVGEMEQIAAAFDARGLPGQFHLAAAEVFGRLKGFRYVDGEPSLAEIIQALSAAAPSGPPQ